MNSHMPRPVYGLDAPIRTYEQALADKAARDAIVKQAQENGRKGGGR